MEAQESRGFIEHRLEKVEELFNNEEAATNRFIWMMA